MDSISLYNNKQYANILPLPTVSGRREGRLSIRSGLSGETSQYKYLFRKYCIELFNIFKFRPDSANNLTISYLLIYAYSLKEYLLKDTFSDTIDRQ